MKRSLLVLFSISLLLAGNSIAATRGYHLGLADNPYDTTVQSVIQTWVYIAKDADMVVYHDDRQGLPWTAAYWGTDYPKSYQDRINFRLSMQAALPPTHKRYLAVTPLNFYRNGIAPLYEAESNPNAAFFWALQPLNADVVKVAYTNHLLRLIKLYQPHYLVYAVEANLLINNNIYLWPQFVDLIKFVHTRIKQKYPDLPLIISFQAEGFYEGFAMFPKDEYLYARIMSQLFPYTDYMAVSSYAYTLYKKPEHIPAGYFTAIAGLTPEKPFVIAETGWPAEPLEAPYNVPATEMDQQRYLSRVLTDVKNLNGRFVILLLPRDYDALWEKKFKTEPDAFFLRIWRDMGLYDGAGNERPSLKLWRQHLLIPLAQ